MTSPVHPSARRRSPRLPMLVTVAAILAGITVAILCFRASRAEVLGEAANDRPFRAGVVRVRFTAEGTPPLLTLNADMMRSGAVVSRRLQAARFQPSVPAVGSVVDPVDLAEVSAELATAESAAGKANADLDLVRVSTDWQQNVLGDDAAELLLVPQDSHAEERLDEADVRSTAASLHMRHEVALALYGPIIAGWMHPGSTELVPILQHRASLLLLTPLPGHAATSLPEEAIVTDRYGETIHAHVVSLAFRIDPRFQTISALYRVDDDPVKQHFVPGMVVSARLLVGSVLSGVVAPASAVLQDGGRSWVYIEEAPGQFRRHEVSLAQALPNGSGWFQDHALQSDQTIVNAGGALLLAEEP